MDTIRVTLILRRSEEQGRRDTPAFADPLTVPARLVWRDVAEVELTAGQDRRDV